MLTFIKQNKLATTAFTMANLTLLGYAGMGAAMAFGYMPALTMALVANIPALITITLLALTLSAVLTLVGINLQEKEKLNKADLNDLAQKVNDLPTLNNIVKLTLHAAETDALEGVSKNFVTSNKELADAKKQLAEAVDNANQRDDAIAKAKSLVDNIADSDKKKAFTDVVEEFNNTKKKEGNDTDNDIQTNYFNSVVTAFTALEGEIMKAPKEELAGAEEAVRSTFPDEKLQQLIIQALLPKAHGK